MIPELDNYLERIEDLRAQVGKLIAGLPAAALNWRPLEGQDEYSTNSLAILTAHVAGAERFWIGEVVGRRPATRDRDAEFRTRVTDSAELLHLLDRVGSETREVLTGLSPAALDGTREARGHTLPVRWCLLHVVDHTALHLGHMQLTYQLWQGGRGVSSPFWYERLPAG
jgi:uncharacterized damage-inducible protein DinB